MTKKQAIAIARFIAAGLLGAVAWMLPLENRPEYITVIAFAVPYLLAGYDVLLKALSKLLKGRVLDEHFLMTAATLGAFAIAEYPEAVAIMLFYQIGEFLQDAAVEKSRASISALIDTRPEYIDVIRDGRIVRALPNEVAAGETVVVRPGERVPLDGIITKGSTTLDTSALTGESLPRDAAESDRVVSSSINLGGLIEMRVTEPYESCTATRILELIEHQGEKKAKSETFIRRFAKIYTPVVVALALALFIIPSLFDGRWEQWLGRALIFLVVSCPCALVVSVPLSFFCGIGGLSRIGVLVKGANYLEALARADTVAFDKTGTLTRAQFKIDKLCPENRDEKQLLQTAALLEQGSNHPIARSIVEAYNEALDSSRVSELEELPGLGIRAKIDGRPAACGNRRLMRELGIELDDETDAQARLHLACGGRYMGYLTLSDKPKPDAQEAISRLYELGIKKTVMLTGDLELPAKQIAAELGVREVKCELLPDEKLACLEELIAESGRGGTVAFVGDGINDAPVLARADVGIAMGALGSDAAIEAADVVLMDDSPARLPTAIRAARKTVSIVNKNIIFALAVKLCVLITGALGLADMWFAVFADVGVTFICVLNALRAMRIK